MKEDKGVDWIQVVCYFEQSTETLSSKKEQMGNCQFLIKDLVP
jgi:hypothetical protein